MDNGGERPDPGRGKHRNPAATTMALPDPRPPGHYRPAHAKPVIPTQSQGVRARFSGTLEDPLVAPAISPIEDSEPSGLRTFDIGTVPASVTPPDTWRKAAWFSVGSTIAVLVGLLAIAAFLMGPAKLHTEITSFPGHPLDVPLPLTTPPSPAPYQAAAPSSTTNQTTTSVATPSAGNASSNQRTTSTSTAPAPLPVPITTLPIAPAPQVQTPLANPGQLAAQTQRFYSALGANLNQAYQLTTGALKAAGELALSQHYQDATSITLKNITVDPLKGITINTVLITRKDGSTTTEQHVLTFSLNDLPLVSGDQTAH